MRIVSMVPSWTETLIEAGVNVVGRTRYCIHPNELVQNIPVVGGTKDWKWEKVRALNPDLIVLDQEENPKFMAKQQEIPYWASKISSIYDMPSSLKQISKIIQNHSLLKSSKDWEQILQNSFPTSLDLEKIPGLIEWAQKPQGPIKNIIYLIWKDPWMSVAKTTFAGSILEVCGFKDLLFEYSSKYPEVDLNSITNKQSCLLLFSSEPYPFLKKKKGLEDLGFPYAFVDGETFTWFGHRSYCALKRYLEFSG